MFLCINKHIYAYLHNIENEDFIFMFGNPPRATLKRAEEREMKGMKHLCLDRVKITAQIEKQNGSQCST